MRADCVVLTGMFRNRLKVVRSIDEAKNFMETSAPGSLAPRVLHASSQCVCVAQSVVCTSVSFFLMHVRFSRADCHNRRLHAEVHAEFLPQPVDEQGAHR